MLCKGENWGSTRRSQEFVIPMVWRCSGELFGVKSHRSPSFCVWYGDNSEKSWCPCKIYCLQFRRRKWLRQFHARLEKCVLSAGETHAHKIPRLRGGGYFVFFLGGGSADFIFMGARIFLNNGWRLEFVC